MKRLLVVTILSALGAAGSGCANCSTKGAPCRPYPVAPTYTVPNACGGGMETYTTPGTIISSPTLSSPQGMSAPTIPGPDSYTVPSGG